MNKTTSNIIHLLWICFAAILISCQRESNSLNSQQPNALDSLLTPISIINEAYVNKDTNGVEVTVKGIITAILSDDTIGDRHQRFIIQMQNGQTLLITHNVDIAPRVAGISIGSHIYAHGEYVWNDQGGLVHWTHHDPDGLHEDGWIVFGNNTYQ